MHEAGGVVVVVVVVAAAAAAHCAEAVAGPWCGCHAGLPNHCSKSRTKGKQTRGRTEGKRKKVDNQKKKRICCREPHSRGQLSTETKGRFTLMALKHNEKQRGGRWDGCCFWQNHHEGAKRKTKQPGIITVGNDDDKGGRTQANASRERRK